MSFAISHLSLFSGGVLSAEDRNENESWVEVTTTAERQESHTA